MEINVTENITNVTISVSENGDNVTLNVAETPQVVSFTISEVGLKGDKGDSMDVDGGIIF